MATTTSNGSNGSVHDGDVSDDSSSTMSSDLDHDITFDVLLPDNTIQKTTILASTPLSDIRTQLLSKFKFSPSAYNVDFISTKQSNNMKRKASLAIGKMDCTMITIKSNKVEKEPTSPKMPYSKESTVRLLVRIARQRQSIIRVSPDVPLSSIFQTICDKLHLSEEARAGLEFRHPTQHEVKLQSKLTLSQYNLRELYLADKHETPSSGPPPPPSRNKTKRKAPGPPRPPNPVFPKDKVPVKKTAVTVEEAHSHKKRAAPLPPSAKPRTIKNTQVDKTEEKAEPVKKESELKVDNKKSKIVVEDTDTKEATDELDRVLLDEFILPSNENSNENSDVSDEEITEENVPTKPTRKPKPEQKSDNLTETETAPTVKNVKLSNKKEASKISQNNDTKNDDNSHLTDDDTHKNGEKIKNDEKIETKIQEKDSDQKVTTPDDITLDVEDTESIPEDDIIDLVNNPTPSPIYLTNNEKNVGKKEEITSEVKNNDRNSKENLNVVKVKKEVNKVTDKIVVKDDKEHDVVQKINKKKEEFKKVEDLPPPPDSMLEDFPLPPPPAPREAAGECFVIKEAATITQPPKKESVVVKHTETNIKNEKDQSDGFDLHIAESFNIPIQAIGEPKTTPPSIKPKPKPIKKIEQDENANHVQTKPEEKLSEIDQAELEIKKIHLQINRMKNQRQKQLGKHEPTLKNRNGQAGEFICTPDQSKQQKVYEEYEVAPIQGIKLSKQGEIKGLNVAKKTKQETAIPQQASKPKQALPSYYKKFLGVNAFKDGVK